MKYTGRSDFIVRRSTASIHRPSHVIGGKLLDSADSGTRVGLVSPPDADKSHGNFVKWQATIAWR
jgi:hypothetical protein